MVLEWIRELPSSHGRVASLAKASSGGRVLAEFEADRAIASAHVLRNTASTSGGDTSPDGTSPSVAQQTSKPQRFSDADVKNYLPGKNLRSIRQCYSVGNLVGAGSFSVVRAAKDIATGKQVAVKVFSQKTRRESILSELRVLQTLRHPNILTYVEHFEEEGQMLLITEFMEGRDLLSAVVDRGSYPEEDARRVISQVLDALTHLHAKRVAHRDLKLENIMLCSPLDSTTLKLIDFGLAGQLSDNKPHLSEVCGTPSYAAPEVLQRNAQYDTQCDVWAVGVMLFMLLSGEPPFQAKTLPQLVKLVRSGSYSFEDPAWELVSEEAKSLVQTLLTVDPRERPTAERALQHPWLQL
jgi:serine/threonine protein kinase